MFLVLAVIFVVSWYYVWKSQQEDLNRLAIFFQTQTWLLSQKAIFSTQKNKTLESDWFLFNYEFKFTIFFFVLLNTVFLMLITLSQEPSLSLSSGTDIDTLKSKSGTSLFRVHFDGAHPKRVCKECRLSLRTKSIEAISLRSRTFGWKCYLTINIKRAWSESLVRKRDARVIFSLLSSFSVSLNGALRKLGGVENWKRGQLL